MPQAAWECSRRNEMLRSDESQLRGASKGEILKSLIYLREAQGNSWNGYLLVLAYLAPQISASS